MAKLSKFDRCWRCNYWFRVWYGVIPGTPEDGITLDKVINVWNVAFPQLGPRYEDGLFVGYDDLENYLDVSTGLLFPLRRRILRTFKRPFTEKEWVDFNEEVEVRKKWLEAQGITGDAYWTDIHEYYASSKLQAMKIHLRDINDNDLKFFDTDIIDMDWHAKSISQTGIADDAECINKRFHCIKELLLNTSLPHPVSEAGFPGVRKLTPKQYEKFMSKCPPYMDNYKHKLVTADHHGNEITLT